MLNICRVVGNLLFIVGYAVVLFGSVELGIYARLVGNLLSWPYFYKVKMWDMITVRSFFAIIEVAKLIQLAIT
ncbi:hypothetical protein SCREM1_87 [Synechococcus phage S-CREM1]|nr:hypothetical protein SCREM1_87 [Synechococcus phage S-CREM1]